MDKFEEIGRRIDEEMTRLRKYLDEEVAPETEKRTASFCAIMSGKLKVSLRRRLRRGRRSEDQVREGTPVRHSLGYG